MDLAARLRRWYRRCGRDLPWRRRPRDAYAQLVAELMLHQTQTATVIPYYERFLARFPTVASLAAADRQAVLELWAGLGYYRRAHHLHAAAQQIIDDFGGRIPGTVDKLSVLPGVGRYTAGAIASIAFDRRAPILDGNVTRVLARVHGIRDPVDDPRTRRRLWELAEELLPRRGCGEVNQALMDLGATVCRRRSPECSRCPLAAVCVACADGTTGRIPAARRRAEGRVVHLLAVVAHSPRRLLLRRRGETGLWAGMWEAPTVELDGGAGPRTRRRGSCPSFQELQSCGLLPAGMSAMSDPVAVGTIERCLTHRTIRFRVVAVAVRHRPVARPYRWWPIDRPPPVPAAYRRILSAWEASRDRAVVDSRPRRAAVGAAG